MGSLSSTFSSGMSSGTSSGSGNNGSLSMGFSTGSGDNDDGSLYDFGSGTGEEGTSGSSSDFGSNTGTSLNSGSDIIETSSGSATTTTTTAKPTIPSAGDVVYDVRWVGSSVTFMGYHHENIEDCCISCNEDEEVWFVHVHDNDCSCFNPVSGVQEKLETAEGFEARVCTDAEREGDY